MRILITFASICTTRLFPDSWSQNLEAIVWAWPMRKRRMLTMIVKSELEAKVERKIVIAATTEA